MRDDRSRWPAAGQIELPRELHGARLARAPVVRQTLVSGPHALRDCAQPLVRWPDTVPDGAYALCLRRDCVLLVDAPDAAEGWDAGLALARSDVSDGYDAVDLSGPRAFELLRHGAEISLEIPSNSAARSIFALPVLLSRGAVTHAFRVHMQRCDREAFLAHLLQAGGR